MTTLYLRFAAPFQSWAGPRVTGNHVNTKTIPTHSGIIGLCAAALGARIGEWPDWLQELSIQVRVDNPGIITNDYQTINPRPEAQRFVERIWLAEGNKGKAPSSFTPDAQKGTSVVKRTYLAGAEFLVALSHPERTEELAAAFAAPGFSPYLGRKAFAPTFPFVLGVGPDGLLETAPVKARRPLGVHVLSQGKDSVYPDPSIKTEPEPFADRLTWWSEKASLPDRSGASPASG